jgi:hypothetical protein
MVYRTAGRLQMPKPKGDPNPDPLSERKRLHKHISKVFDNFKRIIREKKSVNHIAEPDRKKD